MRALAVVAAAAWVAGAAPGGPERLAWLAGCWRMEAGGLVVEEMWSAPAGGLMTGMSRTLRDGRAAGLEFVVIRGEGDSLRYEARPEGQPPATFLATAVSDTHAVFENPTHDFPRLVAYHRGPGDSLRARIEGPGRNGPRRIDFPYLRTPCP